MKKKYNKYKLPKYFNLEEKLIKDHFIIYEKELDNLKIKIYKKRSLHGYFWNIYFIKYPKNYINLTTSMEIFDYYLDIWDIKNYDDGGIVFFIYDLDYYKDEIKYVLKYFCSIHGNSNHESMIPLVFVNNFYLAYEPFYEDYIVLKDIEKKYIVGKKVQKEEVELEYKNQKCPLICSYHSCAIPSVDDVYLIVFMFLLFSCILISLFTFIRSINATIGLIIILITILLFYFIRKIYKKYKGNSYLDEYDIVMFVEYSYDKFMKIFNKVYKKYEDLLEFNDLNKTMILFNNNNIKFKDDYEYVIIYKDKNHNVLNKDNVTEIQFIDEHNKMVIINKSKSGRGLINFMKLLKSYYDYL